MRGITGGGGFSSSVRILIDFLECRSFSDAKPVGTRAVLLMSGLVLLPNSSNNSSSNDIEEDSDSVESIELTDESSGVTLDPGFVFGENWTRFLEEVPERSDPSIEDKDASDAREDIEESTDRESLRSLFVDLLLNVGTVTQVSCL